jgi:hypothetical protein
MGKIKKGITDTILVKSKDKKKEATNSNLVLATDKIVKDLTTTVFDHKEHRLDFALGLLQECQVKKLKNLLEQNLPRKGRLSSTKARNLLEKASKTFRNSFQKTTWAYHCTLTIESDKILGLDMDNKSATKKRDKKTKSKDKGTTYKNKTIIQKSQVKKNTEKEVILKKTSRSFEGKFLDKIKEIEKEIQIYIENGVRWLDLH